MASPDDPDSLRRPFRGDSTVLTLRSIGTDSPPHRTYSSPPQPHNRNLVTEHEISLLYYEASPRRMRYLWESDAKKGQFRCECSRERVEKYLPFLKWIPKYDFRQDLKPDFLCGLTVGIMLIPQGISYGLLADLPPQYGLYACIVAPVIYSLLGTCVQLQVGPFALISLLVANTVRGVVDPETEPERYIEAVLTCSTLVGALLVVMGFLRLGSMVNFLAKPVISGLTTGGAFLIMTSQIGNFLGISIPRGSFFQTWINVFKNLGSVNLPSLGIGLVSLTILLAFREFKQTKFAAKYHLRNVPIALIVMILATVISYATDMESKGVRVLGEIPAGVPAPHVPAAFDVAGELMVPVVVISIVGYALSMATSKTFAAKNNYEVSSNQELFALGLANFIASFFNTYPSFSSLSRSALVHEMGAKTPLHNAFSSLISVFVLTLLTSYLFNLPYPVLAAIIFDSLKSLFEQLRDPFLLWKTDKRDMIIWIATFIAVLCLDVAYGLGIGVAVSLLMLLYTVSNPTYAVMGRFPKLPWIYKDLARFTEAQPVPGILIFRYDSSLHFANGENFRKYLLKAVDARKAQHASSDSELHTVVLDAASISDCDSSALVSLTKVQAELAKDSIELILCSCRGHFRDILKRSKISFQEYVSVHEAVVYASGKLTLTDPLRIRMASSATERALSSILSEGRQESEAESQSFHESNTSDSTRNSTPLQSFAVPFETDMSHVNTKNRDADGNDSFKSASKENALDLL